MKLNVKHTQFIDIEIDEFTHKNLVLNYLKEKFDWDSNYFIEDNKVCNIVEYTTSHRWEQKETVRQATNIDKCLYAIVKEIKSL